MYSSVQRKKKKSPGRYFPFHSHVRGDMGENRIGGLRKNTEQIPIDTMADEIAQASN
jgi:hypothetical protein